MRALFIILYLSLTTSALAGGVGHTPPPTPSPAPVTATGADDSSDNLKQTAKVIVIVGTVICIAAKCWKEKPETFSRVQRRPE